MTVQTLPARRTCIVIVDDYPQTVAMLEEALADEGYETVSCSNGSEALRLIEAMRPAAVLLDVIMPRMDGFTVLRQLRRTAIGRHLPVVLMSEQWRSSDKQRHVGMTQTTAPTVALPKPFALDDLDLCLRQLGVRPR